MIAMLNLLFGCRHRSITRPIAQRSIDLHAPVGVTAGIVLLRRELEVRRHHSDHQKRLTVEHNFTAGHAGVGLKAAPPE